jgi:hypothetical protein
MVVEGLAVLLALAAPYLGFQAIRGFRLYLQVRGSRLVTCPETKKPAVIRVAAGDMAMEAFLGQPCFRLNECSRWPMRGDCGQGCLSQIEARLDN